MKRLIPGILIFCLVILISFTMAHALPNLQVYIPGATANSFGGDEDTWFFTPGSDGNVNFNVVISFGPNDLSASAVTLLLSVPQDQVATGGSITGLTRLGYYTDTSFLPNGADNNHYPLNRADEFDYFIFNLNSDGILKPTERRDLPNYNAETGIITTDSAYGVEITNPLLNIFGYSYVHFDVYALFDNTRRENGIWEINPGSHDSSVASVVPSAVPEPATMLLLGFGLIGMGIFVRRSFKK